jgi:hypothetical protein
MRLTVAPRWSGERRNLVGRWVFTMPMAERTTTRRQAKPRAWYVLGFAALCVALIAAIAIPAAVASRANVIGKTKHTPNPSCPAKKTHGDCSVIGSVTGLMLKADGKRAPFHIFKTGHIVAWAIDLSKPEKSERNTFRTLFHNQAFGGHPSARISVLKSQGNHKYKLIKQSPAVDLKSSLGEKEVFTLDHPLRVSKGQVIGITTPTWASNFALPVNPSDNQWRASRKKSRCRVDRDHPQNIKASRPQQKVGSIRPYGCLYKGARLLYWAYFVPKKK